MEWLVVFEADRKQPYLKDFYFYLFLFLDAEQGFVEGCLVKIKWKWNNFKLCNRIECFFGTLDPPKKKINKAKKQNKNKSKKKSMRCQMSQTTTLNITNSIWTEFSPTAAILLWPCAAFLQDLFCTSIKTRARRKCFPRGRRPNCKRLQGYWQNCPAGIFKAESWGCFPQWRRDKPRSATR